MYWAPGAEMKEQMGWRHQNNRRPPNSAGTGRPLIRKGWQMLTIVKILKTDVRVEKAQRD